MQQTFCPIFGKYSGSNPILKIKFWILESEFKIYTLLFGVLLNLLLAFPALIVMQNVYKFSFEFLGGV